MNKIMLKGQNEERENRTKKERQSAHCLMQMAQRNPSSSSTQSTKMENK